MITSARIASIAPQSDGRRYVTEIQVDDATGEQRFVYLATANENVNAVMAARTVVINAFMAAIPTVTVAGDDGVTATIRANLPNVDMRLTAAQKTALTTARNVIIALRPFITVYAGLTRPQQQWVLTHAPWFSQVLEVLNGG